jgi:hypothetical protein
MVENHVQINFNFDPGPQRHALDALRVRYEQAGAGVQWGIDGFAFGRGEEVAYPRTEQREVPEPVVGMSPADKAQATLLRNLTEAQRKTLREDDYFLVKGSKGNLYRITTAGPISGNVAWVTTEVANIVNGKKAPDTQLVGGTYCAYPSTYGLPRCDIYLGQMLHLITDENDWLKTSFIQSGGWPPTYIQQYPRAVGGLRFVPPPQVACDCPFCQRMLHLFRPDQGGNRPW